MLSKDNQYGHCEGISSLLETAKMFLGPEVVQNVLHNLQQNASHGAAQPSSCGKEDCQRNKQPTTLKDMVDGVVNMFGGEEFVQDVLLNMSGVFQGEDGQQAGASRARPEFRCPMSSGLFRDFAQRENEDNKSTDNKQATSQGSAEPSAENPQPKIPSVSQFLKTLYEANASPMKRSEQGTSSTSQSQEPSVRPKGSQPSKVPAKVDASEFKVEIKAHGFKPEDIQVKVKDGFVIVRAEREELDAVEGITRSIKLDRKLELPEHVDPDEITCQMSEGILTLMAPSTVKPKERLLNINVD